MEIIFCFLHGVLDAEIDPWLWTLLIKCCGTSRCANNNIGAGVASPKTTSKIVLLVKLKPVKPKKLDLPNF